MTQAVTVFRWDDVGAPQIVDGKPSEYMEVLKKCLVDGYGAKAPLDWLVSVDEHLTTAPYMVLKNDTAKGGSGSTVVFDAPDDTAGTLTKVQCCHSFIDKATLINAGNYFNYNRGGTATSLIKNWMVIGTETAFYFFANPTKLSNRNYCGSSSIILFFAGDFQSFYSNDPSRFITLAGSDKDSNNHAWPTMLNAKIGYSSSISITNIYPLDASDAKEVHSIHTCIGNVSFVPGAIFNDATPDISTLVECFLFAGSAPNVSSNAKFINNPILPWLRGKVPGLAFSIDAGYRNVPMPHILVINGLRHFQIPSVSSNASCGWINMEQW